METRIYLKELPCYETAAEAQLKSVGKNPYYDLEQLPTDKMREQFAAFIRFRSQQVNIDVLYGERQEFRKINRFLQDHGTGINSLLDRTKESWIRKLKAWMMNQGMPLTKSRVGTYGNLSFYKAREISYFERVLKFLEPPDTRPEQEKDVWDLEKLDIRFKANPIKSCKSVNFTKIQQPGIREEVKKGIYLNLQYEAIVCVQKEMTALRRLSKYLQEKHPEIQSLKDMNRELLEDYLSPEAGAERAYELLRQAMLSRKEVAIAKTVIGTNEQLLVLYPTKEIIMAKTLFYQEEIQELPQTVPKVRIEKTELEMAKTMIQTMTKNFDIAAYHDEYQARLRAAIEAKIQGQEIVSADSSAPGNIIDLMEAMKRTVEMSQAQRGTA